jgi:hypothetical protein
LVDPILFKKLSDARTDNAKVLKNFSKSENESLNFYFDLSVNEFCDQLTFMSRLSEENQPPNPKP